MILGFPITKEPASVVDWSFGLAKTGSPFLVIKFKLDHQYASQSNGNPDDVFAFKRFYVTEKTTGRFAEFLDSVLGFKGDDILDLNKENGPGQYHDIAGVKVLLTAELVEVKDDHGKSVRNEDGSIKQKVEVSFVNNPNYTPGFKHDSIPDDKMTIINARVKTALALYRAKKSGDVPF